MSEPISKVWIIQNFMGDYNDEYYIPRKTQKFYLTEKEVVAAFLPYFKQLHQESLDHTNGLVSSSTKWSNLTDCVWAELVRFKFCRKNMTEEEVANLTATLGAAPKEYVLPHNSCYEYRLIELSLDASTPVVYPYQDSLSDALEEGDITQEVYNKRISEINNKWWASG